MPTISLYVSDDTQDYLAETIGRGNVSPYIQSLIEKDKGRVKFEEEKRTFEGILNLALLFVGLSFIFLVIGTSYLPWISNGYIIILLAGGVLLTMQSILKIKNGRRVKRDGINNTANI